MEESVYEKLSEFLNKPFNFKEFCTPEKYTKRQKHS